MRCRTRFAGNMRKPECWIMDRASSALAEELLCRLHGLRAEIVVPDAGEAHEAFGRVDQAVEALGQRHRHDSVALALQHQHRRRDLADAQIRTELRSEEHTSELQSRQYLVCRLLLEKKTHMMMNST